MTINLRTRRILVFRNRNFSKFIRVGQLPVGQKLYWIGPLFILTQPKRLPGGRCNWKGAQPRRKEA